MRPRPCSGWVRAHKIGIRGPFGNGFSRGEKVLAIAGGVGAAPLLPLVRSDCVMTMLLGARTESELLFVDQLDECTDVLIATDDGSLGVRMVLSRPSWTISTSVPMTVSRCAAPK